MTIEEILNSGQQPEAIMGMLKEKAENVPSWGKLVREYDPTKHPVMDRAKYPDISLGGGKVDYVTRITYDLQSLAVKRMTELCFGIPVKRIYKPDENDKKQQEVAKYMEAIFQRNRIDAVNIDRGRRLFASCETMTLWYSVEDRNKLYGFDSPIKLRCQTYSPMQGDRLFPLFDETGDLVALSVEYRRKSVNKQVTFFDCYTADRHIRWSTTNNGWAVDVDERHNIGKIPGIYISRPTPIWEDTSRIVEEMEWSMSRNGNYLRKNSKPLFAVFADETIAFGQEKPENEEARSVLQFPAGSNANYITWSQAIDNLKFYISELRQSFFTQLQLPDWSYESMKANPMSGESRKQLFIDAQLKVKDESGRWLEAFDREVNVVKAFLKQALSGYDDAIDSLQVEVEITPYTITDEADTIRNLVTANGGKPLISQRQGVAQLGWSDDVDQTMKELQAESMADAIQGAM